MENRKHAKKLRSLSQMSQSPFTKGLGLLSRPHDSYFRDSSNIQGDLVSDLSDIRSRIIGGKRAIGRSSYTTINFFFTERGQRKKAGKVHQKV